MNFYHHPLAQFVASGLALGIGFVIPALWPVVFFGIWLFVLAVRQSVRYSTVLLGGFVSWFIKMLLVLSWGFSIYPIDWFAVALPGQGVFGIIFYWLVGAALLAVGGAVVAGAIFALRRSTEQRRWLFLPVIWMMAEVTSAYFFSMITWGPGSYLNAAYSYGFVGYLLAEHPVLVLLATLGGVYFLTIVTVSLVGVGVYLYKRFGRLAALALVVLALGYVVPISTTEISEPKTVALIETDFDSYFKGKEEAMKRKEQVLEALDAGIASEAAYVVLPEVSQYTNLNFSPEGAYQMFRFYHKDPNVIVVDSGQAITEAGNAIIRATVYDGDNKAAWQFDKQYLVPQGEYIPTLFTGILKLIGGRAMADALTTNFNYIPGPIKSQESMPDHLPRVLFCFSSADPTAVRNLVGEDQVPFVAHVTSHAWFHHPTILWKQQTAMLKVQAVWSGVSIVQAANMGPAMVYLPNGKAYRPEVVAEGERWRVLKTTI